MHLKDLQAAVVRAHGFASRSAAALSEVLETIDEADHQISIVKELEKGTAIQAMADQIEELRDQLAKRGDS